MMGPAATVGLIALAAALHLEAGASPGERFYRTGLGGSGRPVPVVLRGDVRSDSSTLSCTSCHLGSGFGSLEGGQVAPPLRWHRLSEPGANGHGPRRPYDEKTLLRAVTRGLDSQGRPLSPLMPRYQLGPQDQRDLVAFLRSRGRPAAAGVRDGTLTLAAVLAPDADPRQRRSLEAVLGQFRSHLNPRRRKGAHGPAPTRADGTPAPPVLGYLEWRLATWELRGPPATWPEQLRRRQAEEPAFALVSGLGGATWEPVDRFCEEERIPCILPNVDAPPAEPGWWSLYYSAGVGLEAEVMARSIPPAARVAQVVRPGTPGEAGAVRLARLRAVASLDPAGPVPDGIDTVVLWLAAEEAAAFARRAAARSRWISATAAGQEPPAGMRATVVQPHALPGEAQARRGRFEAWARGRGFERGDFRVQEQTYFAFQLVAHALSHMRDDLDREFLVELLEHTGRMGDFSASYGRLSFGPGQRFLSKGAWVIRADGGKGAPEWVVP